jgi:hypothetical protein
MPEVARHRLLVTLVHGTWPREWFSQVRSFFAMLLRRNQGPRWFDEGSPFLTCFSTELDGIPHEIKRLPWSGKNSIFARDKAAHDLAKHLSAENAQHPQATQLILAHSHGGNIALRALHLLQQEDRAQLRGGNGTNPLVVTLASPFVEVHRADFGQGVTTARAYAFISIAMLLISLVSIFHTDLSPFSLRGFIVAALSGFIALGWTHLRTGARLEKVRKLADLTSLGKMSSVQAARVLVIRAIDDEASLTLALGAITNYVTIKFKIFPILFFVLPVLAGLLSWTPRSEPLDLLQGLQIDRYDHDDGYRFEKFRSAVKQQIDQQRDYIEQELKIGCLVLISILFLFVILGRAVYGRELALCPMECQINTQSTPDAIGLSKVVTLVSLTQDGKWRHSIYDHDNCAKTIADWVRSQLSVSQFGRDEKGDTIKEYVAFENSQITTKE